jgi:hypothetical protein
VRFPILGADFLRNFKLLVDVAGCRLLPAAAVPSSSSPSAGNHLVAAVADVAGCRLPPTAAVSSPSPAAGSHLAAAAVPARPPHPKAAVRECSSVASCKYAASDGPAAGQAAAVGSQHLPEPSASLLAKYSSVTASSLPVTIHGVQHRMATAGSPVVLKFRRLDPERLAAARKEFDAKLEAGIVRHSDSGWSSPLHMVQKKDGVWQPCGDTSLSLRFRSGSEFLKSQ